jgi:hypothetical protein
MFMNCVHKSATGTQLEVSSVSDTLLTEVKRKRKRYEGRYVTPLRAAHLVPPGLSLRTTEGQRFKTVITALIAEYGQHDLMRLRELASLRIVMELTQAEAVSGNASAREDLVRLSNLISRRESELRTRALAAAPVVKDTRPLYERVMNPASNKALGEAKASGRRIGASRPVKRVSEARAQAGDAIRDDEGGDA